MRGRRPSGPEYVARLNGSDLAKQRAQVVLETLSGVCRVVEACHRLDVSEPRFEQLRTEMLQAGVDRLEPRPAGRPAKEESAEAVELRRAQSRIEELEAALRVAEARVAIARILPRAEAAAGKKPSPRPTRTKTPSDRRSARQE
jgi:transposase-like protein